MPTTGASTISNICRSAGSGGEGRGGEGRGGEGRGGKGKWRGVECKEGLHVCIIITLCACIWSWALKFHSTIHVYLMVLQAGDYSTAYYITPHKGGCTNQTDFMAIHMYEVAMASVLTSFPNYTHILTTRTSRE